MAGSDLKQNIQRDAEGAAGAAAQPCGRQITALEAKKQAVADRIKDAMGEAEEVQCGDYTARYKNVTTSRFDAKAFQQNHKRLYAAFCRPQTVRRFTVTA